MIFSPLQDPMENIITTTMAAKRNVSLPADAFRPFIALFEDILPCP